MNEKRFKPRAPRNPLAIRGYKPSFSFLKLLAPQSGGTATKAIHKYMNPTPATKDQIAGQLLEDLICITANPNQTEVNLANDYYLWSKPEPQRPLTTKQNKDAKAFAIEAATKQGKHAIEESQYNRTVNAATLALTNQSIFNLVNGSNLQVPVSGILNGVEVKGYADGVNLNTDFHGNQKIVWDIKSCTNAGLPFLKQVRQNYLDIQLALYMYCENLDLGALIAVEIEPPYESNIFWLRRDSRTFENAIVLICQWLEIYKEAREKASIIRMNKGNMLRNNSFVWIESENKLPYELDIFRNVYETAEEN